MVEYRFGIEDVAAMRFARSPVHELVNSLKTFRHAPSAAMHRAWLERCSGRIDGAALRPIVALVPDRGYTPDFLTPPPAGPSAEIDDELAALAGTPEAQVLRDIENARVQMDLPPAIVEPWQRDPAGTLARTVAVLQQFWDAALAGVWPRVRRLLEADIAHRAVQLTDDGLGATLAGLHPSAHWAADRLLVDTRRTETCVLGGRGLVLMPSVFLWRNAAAITREPWQPTVIYPARGLATVWESDDVGGEQALAGVIGSARARLLVSLDVARSATDLIGRTGMSAPRSPSTSRRCAGPA